MQFSSREKDGFVPQSGQSLDGRPKPDRRQGMGSRIGNLGALRALEALPPDLRSSWAK